MIAHKDNSSIIQLVLNPVIGSLIQGCVTIVREYTRRIRLTMGINDVLDENIDFDQMRIRKTSRFREEENKNTKKFI
jgi:hypothetical protein